MINMLNKFIAPLKRKVQLMVGRCILTAVDNSKDFQELQVEALADEVLDNVERFQNFGHVSYPPKQSQCIILSINGNREHSVAIAVDSKDHRLTGLSEGESALYDQNGNYVWLTSSGLNKIKLKKLKVENDSHELISVLSELIQAIIDARVSTMLGPQPLLNVVNPFSDIKTKLDTFKE